MTSLATHPPLSGPAFDAARTVIRHAFKHGLPPDHLTCNTGSRHESALKNCPSCGSIWCKTAGDAACIERSASTKQAFANATKDIVGDYARTVIVPASKLLGSVF